MGDAFESLRLPLVPVDPDPRFAHRLRARLADALAPSRGAVMADVIDPTRTLETQVADATGDLAAGAATEPADDGADTAAGAAIPYLAVTDARAAIDWYRRVLGARLLGDPIIMDDGRVGHAELRFAHGLLYLADEFPDIGVAAPDPRRAGVSLVLQVPDVDAAVAAALTAGAELTRPVYEAYGHRGGTVVDPFGHRWMLQTPTSPAPEPTETVRAGDIVYTSLWVPDADRAAAFFGAVLGWSSAPAAAGHARQVQGTTPPQGIHGGHERSSLFLCFATDDIAAATDRVRAAGGQAADLDTEEHGITVSCTDDQGTPFALFQLGSDGSDDRPPRLLNGRAPGDLSYITLLVPDSARFRAFHAAVLGWRFEPGHVDDGWGVVDVAPMAGLQGGHPEATGVPMYRVDDIAAAVARVRAAGGTSTDPEQQPYGVTAECHDDQGTHFYLGQM